MPWERSAKSAIVVPTVVVAMMVTQYKNGWNFFALICTKTATIKIAAKIAVPARYARYFDCGSNPGASALSHDMVTASPPVSPRVVQKILMIQKMSVTWGTLLNWLSLAVSAWCVVNGMKSFGEHRKYEN